jgi:hypothetical protein
MIIQLLGVALISLLTITPTIQQNNIEQLIAPNIEIQPLTFTSSNVNRLLVVNQFSHYNTDQFNPSLYDTTRLRTNATNVEVINQDVTFHLNHNSSKLGIYITDNDFYFHHMNAFDITGNFFRNLMFDYYKKVRGTDATSSTFSFTSTTGSLATTTTYYTYSLNSSFGGPMSGRLYLQDEERVDSNSGSLTNSNVTIPQNTTLATLINTHIIPTQTLENQATANANNKILYRFFDSQIPLETVGSYSRTLYSRTVYGRLINHGTVNINITQVDNIPPTITGPTSLTFEVGTYTLVEQLLNNFYTFSDNVGIENAYYFPVTSINTVGTFNITVFATDAAGNQTNLPVTITTTAPPPQDNTAPTILGPNSITVELGQINNDGQLINQFQITDDITQPSAISKVLTGTRSYTEPGFYSLTLTATDVAGNFSTKNFTFRINEPYIDDVLPIIESPSVITFKIGDFLDRQEILDFYVLATDNIEISSLLLVGNIDFTQIGNYTLQIIATDSSQNQVTQNVLIRIQQEIILGNYNPLTDLLSGIFGGALSMIFTIGTINVLGLRLLDAMGVIILGAVLLFVYKAIKGGS